MKFQNNIAEENFQDWRSIVVGKKTLEETKSEHESLNWSIISIIN